MACLASVVLYCAAFAFVLDRPLGLGAFRRQIEANLARGAASDPKLVVIAGSNGPYSHRCETIQPLTGRVCINAGIAVGIGLDYLFARWKPLLRPGDWVYLPLEDVQYARSRTAVALGPDAAIMLRHDRATLARLPPDRWVAAAFAADLRAALMSAIEMSLVAGRFSDPRDAVNAWGDRIGHTPERAAANAARLATLLPHHAAATSIRAGYGAQLVAEFLEWAKTHGIVVVGGPPTGFADAPPPETAIAAIQDVYRQGGARFLSLPDRGRYPRSDFFDSPDHLHEHAQIAHSRAVGVALAALMAAEPSPTR